MSTFIVAAIIVILFVLVVRHMRNNGTGCCSPGKDECSSGSCPNCKK